MPTNEELQTQITELASKIEGMEVGEIDSMQLKYPLDVQSRKIVEDVVRDNIIDIVWNDYFYYNTSFESLDALALIDGSAGSSIISEIGIQLHTGATINNTSSVVRAPRLQEIISFDNHSRFRTSFRISNASINDIEFNVTVGQGAAGVVKNHYGFRLENDGDLKGIVADGSTESTVTLISSLTPQANYIVEARLLPSRVVFFVSGTDDDIMIERGGLSSNIPTGVLDTTSGGEDNVWLEYLIKTLANDSKIVLFSFFEYIQER